MEKNPKTIEIYGFTFTKICEDDWYMEYRNEPTRMLVYWVRLPSENFWKVQITDEYAGIRGETFEEAVTNFLSSNARQYQVILEKKLKALKNSQELFFLLENHLKLGIKGKGKSE